MRLAFATHCTTNYIARFYFANFPSHKLIKHCIKLVRMKFVPQ